jgi:hypothetical protein
LKTCGSPSGYVVRPREKADARTATPAKTKGKRVYRVIADAIAFCDVVLSEHVAPGLRDAAATIAQAGTSATAPVRRFQEIVLLD